MVKVLKIIATPFIKLWTWIKETAWVQPLLIVGIIFAVIFSIPSITSWVQSWDFGSDTYTYLKDHQLSLEGLTDQDSNGEAAEFFKGFNAAQDAWQNGDKDTARNSLRNYVGDANKMMFFVVNEDDTAANVNETLNYLVNESWTRVTSFDDKAPAFQFSTIFADQTIETDDNTYADHSPFDFLFNLPEYQEFIIQAASVAKTGPYYRNRVSKNEDISSIESSADNLPSPDSYSSTVPYYLIIDLTDANTTQNIITNVFFEVTGEDKYSRADFVAHAWTNTEEFAI